MNSEPGVGEREGLLFFTTLCLCLQVVAILLLIGHRGQAPFSILGWHLVLLSSMGCTFQVIAGLSNALYAGHFTTSRCELMSFAVSFLVPTMVLPILLAALRLLFFFRIEEQKVLAADGSIDNRAAVGELFRVKSWMGPKTDLLVLVLGLVPAALAVVGDVTKGSLTETTTEGLVWCKISFSRIVVLIYGAVFTPASLYLAYALRKTQENFGIKRLYSRYIPISVGNVVIWFILSNRGYVVQSMFFACMASHSWPLIAVLAPLALRYKNWSPASVKVVEFEKQHLLRNRRSQTSGSSASSPAGRDGKESEPPTSPRSTNSRRSRRISQGAAGLLQLLSSEDGLQHFTEFLKQEFASESLFFYLAVQGFKAEPTHRQAMLIIELYLLENSALEVNVGSDVRASLVRFYVQHSADPTGATAGPPPANMFEQAETEIIALLARDSYRRYADKVKAEEDEEELTAA